MHKFVIFTDFSLSKYVLCFTKSKAAFNIIKALYSMNIFLKICDVVFNWQICCLFFVLLQS